MDQLVQFGIVILVLLTLLRLVSYFGRHSHPEEVKRLLGEALALTNAQGIANHQDDRSRAGKQTGAGKIGRKRRTP